MSSDRELLEKAAKAAGLPYKWLPALGRMSHIIDAGRIEHWNPLADDGDALRLAVKLNLTIQRPWDDDQNDLREIRVWSSEPDYVFELTYPDPYASTRRAIVRAAAALGDAP